MLATLAAAAVLAGGFTPPDCVTRHWQRPANGPLVVAIAHKHGLWEMSPAGTVIRRLTAGFPGAGDIDPQFSADRRRIAYLHGSRQLWVRNLGGGARRVLALPGPDDDIEDPRWSPDGDWIAFVRRESDPVSHKDTLDVARIHPGGTGLESLGPVSEETFPEPFDWSPNGVCMASQEGQIEALNLSVGPVLTRAKGDGFLVYGKGIPLAHGGKGGIPIVAVFSPDGRVLYVSDTRHILAVRLDRRAPVRRAIPEKAVVPVPSPDGRLLAFGRSDRQWYVSRLGSGHAVHLPHVSAVVDWWSRR